MGFLCSLVSPLPLLYSLGLLQRSAAQTETAGDSEELLARVVGPTSSSYFLPVAGKGHIPCLENVTEHPTPGAILEMHLDKETVATTDHGALSVWRTRTAQRGRAAETTHVSVTLSAPLTLTALAPRWGVISYRMVVIIWSVITLWLSHGRLSHNHHMASHGLYRFP